MRTIPEIVEEMKQLIAELESHTGLPAKKTDPYTQVSDDTIKFTFDNMNTGDYTFSHYENMGDITLGSVGSDTITLGPIKN
jgi:hypothetical protein